MSFGDISILKNAGDVITVDRQARGTSSESTTLQPGELAIKESASGNYGLLIRDGDASYGSTDIIIGLCKTESDETSAADGTFEAYQLIPGFTVLYGSATTTGNMDTATEMLGLMFDNVNFDLSAAPKVTIDENDGDDPNQYCVCIIEGDIIKHKLEVTVNSPATISGPWSGQTID